MAATASAIAMFFAATPALAAATVTSVQIRSALTDPSQAYIQIAELQLFGGSTNYALTGVASATSVYENAGANPSNANDGSLASNYPAIYHSNASNGSDVFTLTLAAATSIDRISIYGRTDCCSYRDVYSYTLLNGAQIVGTGTLDARSTSFATANVTAAVPEPATWAMMIAGFGLVGGTMRRRSTKIAFA